MLLVNFKIRHTVLSKSFIEYITYIIKSIYIINIIFTQKEKHKLNKTRSPMQGAIPVKYVYTNNTHTHTTYITHVQDIYHTHKTYITHVTLHRIHK